MSGWWLIHREAEKAPLLSFQKLIEAENTPLSPQTFFFLTVYTEVLQKRNFTGARFPLLAIEKKRRVVRYPHFLAEEISKVSILVREVAREIRAGAVCLCPPFLVYFFSTFRIALRVHFFFCDVSLHIEKEI